MTQVPWADWENIVAYTCCDAEAFESLLTSAIRRMYVNCK